MSCSRLHADTAGVLCARRHQQKVGSQRANLFRHLRLRACADRDHADHGSYSDDDSECGQDAAHLVNAQRPPGNAQALQEIQEIDSITAAAASEAPLDPASSCTICPSWMV